MNSIEAYPSTFDFKPIKGGQDPVLSILNEALKRYNEGASQGTYMSNDSWNPKAPVQVCAVGAVMAAAGMSPEQLEEVGLLTTIPDVVAAALAEQPIVDAVKAAMELLDNAALKLFPRSAGYDDEGHIGPLEYVNQEYHTRWRGNVRACYNEAIRAREEQIACTPAS